MPHTLGPAWKAPRVTKPTNPHFITHYAVRCRFGGGVGVDLAFALALAPAFGRGFGWWGFLGFGVSEAAAAFGKNGLSGMVNQKH